MAKSVISVAILAILLSLCVGEGTELYYPPRANKISPGLRTWLSAGSPEDVVKAWVFFTDKGILTTSEYGRALRKTEAVLTERARRRRLKARAGTGIVDYHDLPVHTDYVRQIRDAGAKVEVTSRWLNGVSVRIGAEHLREIEKLPFVREIRKVVSFKKSVGPGRPVQKGSRTPPPRVPLDHDYGLSWTQDSLLNIHGAHQMGYTGAGVLICMLDTGFDFDRTGPPWIKHECLRHMKDHLVAEWDFIRGDSMTGYDPADSVDLLDPNQTNHGTEMLSLIAGFKNSQLIGPAFRASYALARTEWYRDGGPDVIAEEHLWIAGSEWADSLGADIVSSSLGYRVWEDSSDYRYEDLNGDSTPLTIAADIAASRGILLVNALGNVYWGWQTNRPDTCMVAPADADSIIAVGGVEWSDVDSAWIWAWNDTTNSGSAIGPPYDQLGIPPISRTRWKPDLVGPWNHNVCNPDSAAGYLWGQGTSGATALIAGACALVMEANPSWSNMKVREALLQNASNHESPDDTLGHGIPDVVEAIGEDPEVPPFTVDELGDPYPNPFRPASHDSTVFPYQLMNQTRRCVLSIYSASGELVRKFDLGTELKMPGRYITPPTGAFVWNGHNQEGDLVGSGIYVCILSTGFNTSVKKLAVVR